MFRILTIKTLIKSTSDWFRRLLFIIKWCMCIVIRCSIKSCCFMWNNAARHCFLSCSTQSVWFPISRRANSILKWYVENRKNRWINCKQETFEIDVFACEFSWFFFHTHQAIALATATLVGNALGAAKPDDAAKGIKLLTDWTLYSIHFVKNFCLFSLTLPLYKKFFYCFSVVRDGIYVDFFYGLFAGMVLLFLLRPHWGSIYTNDKDVQSLGEWEKLLHKTKAWKFVSFRSKTSKESKNSSQIRDSMN